MEAIFQQAWSQLRIQISTVLPPLIVACLILAAAYLMGHALAFLVRRAFKARALENVLRETGFGRIRGEQVLAGSLFWGVMIVGILAALNAFDTALTGDMITSTMYLFPRVIAAVLVMVAGIWLGRSLGWSALVWATEEQVPSARLIAAAVRVAIVFTAAVIAAHVLRFAEHVFLAAFIIFAGGATLAAALAVGLGARESVQRYLGGHPVRPQTKERDERTLWNHL